MYTKQNEFEAIKTVTSQVVVTLDDKNRELDEININIDILQKSMDTWMGKKQSVQAEIAELIALGLSPSEEE